MVILYFLRLSSSAILPYRCGLQWNVYSLIHYVRSSRYLTYSLILSYSYCSLVLAFWILFLDIVLAINWIYLRTKDTFLWAAWGTLGDSVGGRASEDFLGVECREPRSPGLPSRDNWGEPPNLDGDIPLPRGESARTEPRGDPPYRPVARPNEARSIAPEMPSSFLIKTSPLSTIYMRFLSRAMEPSPDPGSASDTMEPPSFSSSHTLGSSRSRSYIYNASSLCI